MAKRIIDEATLTSLADAVRELIGGTEKLTPDEMIQNILSASASDIINIAEGEIIQLFDCATRKIRGLTLYGKTTQNGIPTPETPIPLASGDGSIEVTLCGRNIFRGNSWDQSNKDTCGIVFTTRDDGAIVANGTAAINTAYFTNWEFKAGTTYTFSGCPTLSGVEMVAYIEGAWTGAKTDTGKGVTWTQKADAVGMVALRVLQGTVANNLVFKPQLEIGSTATAFEPYTGQIMSVSTSNGLPGIPVASNGNYTDANGKQWIADEIDFARGKYIQRIGVKVYTGSETWRKTGINTVNSYAADNSLQPPANTSALPIASHFTGTTNNSIIGAFLANENSAVFGVDKSMLTNLDEWTAWLQSQHASGIPLTVLYMLKTPIETDLTAAELAAYSALHTNYPQTVIYNDANAWMSVKYVVAVATEGDGNSGGGGSGGMLVCDVEDPSNQTRIGEVHGLEISFPNATSIADYAFNNNANLKAISLPNVTTIGIGAFSGTYSLAEVYAPNAATIGGSAFWGSRISIADFPNATTIGRQVFHSSESLKTVRMPKLEVVTEATFWNCINLEKIDIPTATMLEQYAFGCSDGYYNDRLTVVDLPKATSIGMLAFRNCRKLTAVILRTTSTVCACEFSAFEDTPMMTGEGHIYVPAVMYEYYRAGYEAALDQLMPGFFDILFRKIEDYPEICG